MSTGWLTSGKEELGCYSQTETARTMVQRPANVDELKAVFAAASAAKTPLTLRSGGHAFDSQSLGKQLVVSLACLDDIGEVVQCDGKHLITVGAGATWADILEQTAKHGLVPRVMVTAKDATAGGTLSADCISRFSNVFGKEGSWVTQFTFVTLSGDVIVCRPPGRGGERSRGEEIFLAAIGGLGYLGAIVEITYELAKVGDAPSPAQPGLAVRTNIHKHRTWDKLAKYLVQDGEVRELHAPASERDGCLEPLAVSCFLCRQPVFGWQSPVVFTSRYVTTSKRKPLSLHQSRDWKRFLAELLVRTRREGMVKLLGFYFLFLERNTYIDDLHDFTFFMEGNVAAKEWGKSLGIRMPTIQQTFVIPHDEIPTGPRLADVAARKAIIERLVGWLGTADSEFRSRGSPPRSSTSSSCARTCTRSSCRPTATWTASRSATRSRRATTRRSRRSRWRCPSSPTTCTRSKDACRS